MNERIATVTVIRGEGGCDAIVNGIVNKELQRMRQRMDAEAQRVREDMDAEVLRMKLERDRRKSSERLRELKEKVGRRDNPVERIWLSVYGAVNGFINACIVYEPRKGSHPKRGRKKGMR